MTTEEASHNRHEDVMLAFRCGLVPNDEEAWRQLWGRYQGLVGWRVRRTLSEEARDETEDVVQEAFMRFQQVAFGFNPEKSSLAGYLSVIARSVARDWERRSRKERANRVPLPEPGSGDLRTGFEVDPEVLMLEGHRQLKNVRNQRKRKVFEAFLALKTPEQVKLELGVPKSTAYRLQEQYRTWLTVIADSLLPDQGKINLQNEKTGR